MVSPLLLITPRPSVFGGHRPDDFDGLRNTRDIGEP